MSSTVINVVPDTSLKTLNYVETNVEMEESNEVQEENSSDFSNKNDYLARSLASDEELLRLAAENNSKNYTIFLQSESTEVIPKRNPRAIQIEIKSKIKNSSKIDNVRFTRTGSMIFFTKDVECAIDICKVSSFLGVSVKSRIIWENITNRFLLFNIPVDIPLDEIANELEENNNIRILELRRFLKRGSTKETSPILVTILGTNLPQHIKMFYTLQNIKQFVDRPRQCGKCYKYNHSTIRCPSEKLCINCGKKHNEPCTEPTICINCGGEHKADNSQCPTRVKEINILEFKCRNFLSITEARRRYNINSVSTTYSTVTSTSNMVKDNFQKIFEDRTNYMLKIIIESFAKEIKRVTEAINKIQNPSEVFSDIEQDNIEEKNGTSQYKNKREDSVELQQEIKKICLEKNIINREDNNKEDKNKKPKPKNLSCGRGRK